MTRILVDTSVWVDHFRAGQASLPMLDLLDGGRVIAHPFVIGELTLGGVRADLLAPIDLLPLLLPAPHVEVLALTRSARLVGRGIGWADAHLVASARRSQLALWTLDRSLRLAAKAAHVELFTHP
jgi:predicted nucleic acid-binding protein